MEEVAPTMDVPPLFEATLLLNHWKPNPVPLAVTLSVVAVLFWQKDWLVVEGAVVMEVAGFTVMLPFAVMVPHPPVSVTV